MPEPNAGQEREGARAALARWLPPVLVVLLVGLELARGARRIADLEAAHRSDLQALIERQQARLAGEVAALSGEAESHALYLARAPAVHALLRSDAAPRPEAAAELERALLPHLASFRGIDRVTVLDAEGVELVRCERMGDGVAAMPAELLDAAPRADLLALGAGLRPGAVAASELVDDAERVEVSAADRRVFHYVTPVGLPEPGAGGLPPTPRGWVAVTAYAAPLLRALKGFAPLPGTWSVLLDAEGDVFAAPERDAEAWRTTDAAGLVRAAAARADRTWSEQGGAALLATPVEGEGGPAVRLVTAIPVAALDAASGLSARERIRAASASLVMLLAIALATALFARQGLRAARLREAERYLRRLRDEVRRYRALMEAAADVLLVLSPSDGRVRDWNRQAGLLFDLDAPAAPSGAAVSLDRVLAAFEPEARDVLRAALEAALATPGAAVQRAGLRMRGPSGEADQASARELDLRCVALEYAGEALVEVALVDRTREREMERRVQTQDRLSSLGLFTAGIAHEINNPLEGIGNYVALLERGKADEGRRAFLLRQVRGGLERIQAIVGDLLRFARTSPDEGRADLAAAVEGALSMARFTEHLSGVTVERSGLDAPLFVRGSGRRLEQVLLNLLLNAGRAMGGRGRIAIAARRAEGDWVELAVEDEGPGIAPEDLPRLFDPFFTKSGGSGLGLSVSYGIVRTIGGELFVEHRAGGGARFVVRLPDARHADPQRSEQDPEREHGKGRSEPDKRNTSA
jgi:signal transduction histidine kinase